MEYFEKKSGGIPRRISEGTLGRMCDEIHGAISEAFHARWSNKIHYEIQEGIASGISERIPGKFSKVIPDKNFQMYSWKIFSANPRRNSEEILWEISNIISGGIPYFLNNVKKSKDFFQVLISE